MHPIDMDRPTAARAILSDLDRTLTGADLVPDEAAIERIRALRARGIRVIVVTGRRLDDLLATVIPRELDALVAENGAIVMSADTTHLKVDGVPWTRRARAALGGLASSFQWGRVVGSGPRKLADDARAALARHNVTAEFSFNAEELMLLPPGVDKAAGATQALALFDLKPEDAWSIGDGENDVPLLSLTPTSAAPANAHPTAKAAATKRLSQAYSKGFIEFTEPLMTDAR